MIHYEATFAYPSHYNRPYGLNTNANVFSRRRLKQSIRPFQATIPMSISNTPNTYKLTNDKLKPSFTANGGFFVNDIN